MRQMDNQVGYFLLVVYRSARVAGAFSSYYLFELVPAWFDYIPQIRAISHRVVSRFRVVLTLSTVVSRPCP
jgi:hypothetical protein